MSRPSILIAKDHTLVAEAVARLLQDRFSVVAHVGNARELFAAVTAFRPDTVILAILRPGMSGIEAARELQRVAGSIRIVVLSMHREPAYVRDGETPGRY